MFLSNINCFNGLQVNVHCYFSNSCTSYLSGSITAPAFLRSSFVTLFVLFNGFDLKDRFEKKFCKKGKQYCQETLLLLVK